MRLSIVMPVYNEVENLQSVISEIVSVLKSQKVSHEIICIDDGSTDGSRGLLENLQEKFPSLKTIFFRRNTGQAAAFDAGFRAASGEFVFTMDGDGQNDPSDILPMLKLLEKDYDFVSGWRKKRKDGFVLRKLPSRIANSLIRKVTNTKLHDMGCSLKGYRREISSQIRLYGEMHRFVAILAENLGARTTEFVVNHRARQLGISKYGISRTPKVVLDLLTVWFMKGYQTKPIYVFGGIGLGVMGISSMMAMWVLYEKLSLGIFVHKNPLMLLSVALFVMGFQFMGLGLVAEILVRTYFESQQSKQSYNILSSHGFEQATVPWRKTSCAE
jgi:glycosyltransferase involved in cell wall biosynthesis